MANKSNEILDLSVEDLQTKIQEEKKKYFDLKFDKSITEVSNPLEIRDTRRNIARLKTALRAKEIVALTPEEVAGRSKIRFRRSKK